jgi:hypothetical protein
MKETITITSLLLSSSTCTAFSSGSSQCFIYCQLSQCKNPPCLLHWFSFGWWPWSHQHHNSTAPLLNPDDCELSKAAQICFPCHGPLEGGCHCCCSTDSSHGGFEVTPPSPCQKFPTQGLLLMAFVSIVEAMVGHGLRLASIQRESMKTAVCWLALSIQVCITSPHTHNWR